MAFLLILNVCADCSADSAALFDASQYAFFCQDAVEEVELGGLEEDIDGIPVVGYANDEYHLFEKDEVGFLFTQILKVFARLNLPYPLLFDDFAYLCSF